MTRSENFDWKDYVSVVDSSLSQKAIENVVRVDTQMLFHMDDLQDRVQRDLTRFQPVIVAQFTPGGGKFTLLRNEYGREARVTIEPVPNLFGLSKSIAHAPLGIFGCFGPYSTDPCNQGWREPLKAYRSVLSSALDTLGSVKDGFQIDDELRKRLVADLNAITGVLDGSNPVLTEATVEPHIVDVLGRLLKTSINFIDDDALTLGDDESPPEVFQQWCNRSSEHPDDPDDTLYKLIVQCQVMAACTQQYGISTLIKRWRSETDPKDWKNLYAVVEAEWVTREMNSIAQCILPEMEDGEKALNEHLLIVTNLSDVDPALHFLARILEDRAAAALILTGHSDPRNHLSGQVDLLGPVMSLVCSHMKKAEVAVAPVE